MIDDIIVASPPTPNGSVHLGHIAGPYLASDIMARHKRFMGNKVCYVTGLDSNQSYVVSKALQLKMRPQELGNKFGKEILQCFDSLDIKFSSIYTDTAQKREYIECFFRTLYDKGKFIVKTTSEYYCAEKEQFLYDSFIKGYCPNCFAHTKGNICENCSFPNVPSQNLLGAESTLSAKYCVRRNLTNLYFPLEDYRESLTKFLLQPNITKRPKLEQYLYEILKYKLPDIAIGVPSKGWGQTIEFYQDASLVYNPWLEILPSMLFLITNGGEITLDSLMKSANLRWYTFFGFDNSFFFTICHLALLTAYNLDFLLQQSFFCNEFLLLNNNKFSSSTSNALWVLDIKKEFSSDIVRLALAVHSPEFKRDNFNINSITAILDEVTSKLQYILNSLQPNVVTIVSNDNALIKSACEQFRKRFDNSLKDTNYSISNAAKVLLEYLNFLYMETQHNLSVSERDLCSIYHSLVHIFIPIIPNTAKSLGRIVFNNSSVEQGLHNQDIVNTTRTIFSFDPQHVLAALQQK